MSVDILGTNCDQCRSMVQCCFTSTETIRFIRDGEKGGKGVRRGGGGEREIIYLSLHCHHQNYSCIKMGSDEGHFNISLIVSDKVTRQCPQTATFSKRIRTEALLLTSLTPYRYAKPALGAVRMENESLTFHQQTD